MAAESGLDTTSPKNGEVMTRQSIAIIGTGISGLTKKHTYLVTLNQEIAKEHVLQEFTYHHPIFSLEAIKAQAGWEIISGKNRSHYCGAYWFNGFHEEGVKSGLKVKMP